MPRSAPASPLARASLPDTCSNVSGAPVIMSKTDSSLATLPLRIGLKK